MAIQVAVIEVKQDDQAKAVFLDGEYQVSTDPGCAGSVEAVEEVAISLAMRHGLEITFISSDASNKGHWHALAEELKVAGKLVDKTESRHRARSHDAAPNVRELNPSPVRGQPGDQPMTVSLRMPKHA